MSSAIVSASVLDVLGLSPILGRFFVPDEEIPGYDAIVVLSHAFWLDRYGGDPSIIGQDIHLNARARTVIGIGPAGFRFPEVADMWVPLAFHPTTADPNDFTYDVVARLASGSSLAEARAEGTAILERLAQTRGWDEAQMGVDVYPLRRADVNGSLAWSSILLLCAVSIVLLIACSNLAALVTARGIAKRDDLAVRAALGASRWQIVSHLLSETMLLTTAGAAAGTALAFWMTGLLNAILPSDRPFWMVLHVDGSAIAFIALLCAVSTILIGLVPALRSTRGALGMRRTRGIGRALTKTHTLVLGAQVAGSFALLASAGLVLDALSRLNADRVVADPDRAAVVVYQVEPRTISEPAALTALHQEILAAVRDVPGLVRVGAASDLPLIGGGDEVVFDLQPWRDDNGPLPVARLYAVTPGFLDAFGATIVAGRDIDELQPGEVLISASLAVARGAGRDVLGQRLRHGSPGSRAPVLDHSTGSREIVGVVSDVSRPGQATTPLAIYVSHLAFPMARAALVLRTSTDPLAAAVAARERVAEVTPAVLVESVRTLESVFAEAISFHRLFSLLLTSFAVAALAMAAVGLWGAMAYAVSLRADEFAIRRVLGARGRELLGMLLKRVARVLVPSVLLGAVLAWGVGRALHAVVPGVEGGSGVPQLAAAALIIAVALLASVLPARRALRVEPAERLR